ncbi:rhomboid-related protein 2 [Dendroctonus ponderosae]|uniref:EF-hand domain-containing protein n=1 Tax=Dendroctonus ponderosae TaxID=77166 RepID=A0AAR5QIJ9_DENPD|nr:rhomboid-related protein 2 [Dendroctonus ponderosae]
MSGNQSGLVTIPLENTNKPNDYFKGIFEKYDKDHDGLITVKELSDMIESREYDKDIPDYCVKKIHDLHDVNQDRKLNFDEFMYMIHNPEYSYIFGHYISRYINWIIPPKRIPPSHTVTDGIYEEEYSCNPPAVGMIILSLVEILCFCIDEVVERDSTKYATGPVATVFIYEPHKRYEIWRFFTYMFVHIGVFHLLVNLAVQILLGIPLEMVHKWWRVLVVYFAGVLAGSLATSITDPDVRLAGASGGVYSLITAHVASIIMNWREMSYPLIQLFVFILVAVSDIGTAIYYRYVLDKVQSIGYVAHFAGAVAGLLVGINVLRNLSVSKTEKVLWWISLTAFVALLAVRYE